MTNLITNLSQHKAVTILRILYPIWFVVGLFGVMYVPSTLIVSGDAAATANNIVANELLFNMGIVGSLITQLIHIVVVLVLYKLFKSVSKNHAVLLVVLGLVGVPIAMLNELNKVAALILSKGAGYLAAFESAQLHSLMMFFLNLNEQGIFILGSLAFTSRISDSQIRLFSKNLGHLHDIGWYWIYVRAFCSFSCIQLRGNNYTSTLYYDNGRINIYGLGYN